MESLATLVPFEMELDWGRVAGSAVRIAAILLVGGLAYVALRVVRSRVGRMPIESGPGANDRLQRRKTLASVMSTAGLILIAVVTLMMVLETVGLPLGPLLATAGVASLAIGFGAQTLAAGDPASVGDGVGS